MGRNRSRAHLSACLLVLSIASCAPGESFRHQADRYLEDLRQKVDVPSVSAAVGAGGAVVYTGATGLADLSHDVPATPDTVYNIGSVSKVLTAVAVMQLVEKGAVGLDDSIRDYVPELPEQDAKITLRHLMTHTSGIRHYRPHDWPEGTEWDNVGSYETFAEAITLFKDDPLLFPPGDYYFYSSYAVNLFQGVIERVSGQSFEEYMGQHVWTPAGMSSTAVDRPERIVRGHARGYDMNSADSPRNYYPRENVTYKFPSGGMLSTAGDLARFALALGNGTLLEPETTRQMFAPQIETVTKFEENGDPPRVMNFQQALMWRRRQDDAGRTFVYHCGTLGGYNSCLVIYPEEDLIVATTDNGERVGFVPLLELAEIFRNAAGPARAATEN